MNYNTATVNTNYTILYHNNGTDSVIASDTIIQNVLNTFYSLIYSGATQCNDCALHVSYGSLSSITSIFKLKYENGAVYMYNNLENIKISSLFPSMVVYESFISNNKNFHNQLARDNMNTIIPTVKTPSTETLKHQKINPVLLATLPKTRASIRIPHPSINKQTPNPPINKQTPDKQIPDKQIPDKQQNIKKINDVITNDNQHFGNDKGLPIFESDKKSYSQMKQDILQGIIKVDNINPSFIYKYHIFKVLETRNAIDFTNNQSIKKEYDIFKELQDECEKDECEEDACAKDTCKPSPMEKVNIYVPHNYSYMTPDQKEHYAKKYKMSQREFEENYINTFHDDIEEKIMTHGSNESLCSSGLGQNEYGSNESLRSSGLGNSSQQVSLLPNKDVSLLPNKDDCENSWDSSDSEDIELEIPNHHQGESNQKFLNFMKELNF